MKRIIVAVLAVMMIAVVCAGCKVTTTVESQYVDDFINDYATQEEIDENGNVTYKFDSKDTYEQFAKDYYEEVKEESRVKIESTIQYSYYNPEITEIVVGITPESYEELGDQVLKAEAQAIAEEAMKYQMNLKDPEGKIDVTYINANTSEEYFTITVEAE